MTIKQRNKARTFTLINSFPMLRLPGDKASYLRTFAQQAYSNGVSSFSPFPCIFPMISFQTGYRSGWVTNNTNEGKFSNPYIQRKVGTPLQQFHQRVTQRFECMIRMVQSAATGR